MQRNLSPVRGSRFVEGSMNDRASKVPPSEFIEAQNLRNAHHRAKSRAAQQHSGAGYTAEKADTARQSGIFRFGKSVAATFNPANWKIWKPQPQLDETAHQKSLRERQEKAERIYKELKETGKFRDSAHPPSFHVTEYDSNIARPDGRRGKHDDNYMKHDSGIEFGTVAASEGTTKEEKRRGRVFLEPPNVLSDDEHHHSDPSTSGPTRTSVQSTRPISFTAQILQIQPQAADPSPRKLRSSSRTGADHGSRRRSLSIPRIRRGSFTRAASPRASESEDPAGDDNNNNNNMRRVLSRSDLQKQKQKRSQRKLVKRVSDLEIKLAAARQELLSTASAEGGENVAALSHGSESESQSQSKPQSQLQEENGRSKNGRKAKKMTKPQPSSSSSTKIQTQQRPLPSSLPPRDLSSSTTNGPITRPRFIPGTLATLPSERLLSAYIQSSPGKNEDLEDSNGEEKGKGGKKADGNDEDADVDVDVEKIGRAVSTDYGERREGFEWPDYVF